MSTVLWAALLLGVPAQDTERSRVFEIAKPSVVALRSPDGHGSGLILDEAGLILTNAHVMTGAEAYTCDVDNPHRLTYRSVTLVGVHPKMDLALVRINPKEHPHKLQPIKLAAEAPANGAPVYAVGFPWTAGGHAKTITGGEVKAVNRYIDGRRYFEVSTEVWGGNSGGPVCNHRGEAVGIITLGFDEGFQRYGAAIPIDEYRPEVFVPLNRRPSNPAAAHRYLQAAEQMLKEAREGHAGLAGLAESCFQMALIEDISNPDIYFKIGLIRRNVGNKQSAVAYLIRALLLDPAPSGGAKIYTELGIAFAETGRKAEARAVWQEGLLKYPDETGMIWDSLAVDHWREGRYLECAVASRASIKTFAPRGEAMNKLYEECLKRLSAEEKLELRRREEGLGAHFAELKTQADLARRSGKAFVVPECEKALRTHEGLRQGGEAAPARPKAKGSVAGDVDALSDAEVTRLFAAGQYRVAREHLRAARFQEAEEAFAEVLKLVPGTELGNDARRYLEVLRERKK